MMQPVKAYRGVMTRQMRRMQIRILCLGTRRRHRVLHARQKNWRVDLARARSSYSWKSEEPWNT